MRKNILMAAVWLLAAATAQAEVYKWVDANGRVVFSDQPPPGKKVDKVKVYPAGPAAVRQGQASAAAATAPSLENDVKSLNERIEKHNRDVKAQNCKTAQGNLQAQERAAGKGADTADGLRRAREEVQIWCGK